MGETSQTTEDAATYIASYKKAINFCTQNFSYAPHPHQQPVTISLKPSLLCNVDHYGEFLRINPLTPLESQLLTIVHYAQQQNISITIDMEDHHWTTHSLNTAKNLWLKRYNNLGIVLQSRLYRTTRDITTYIKTMPYPFSQNKLRVRACIGIYRESPAISTNNKKQMKQMLIKHIADLLNSGVYVEIATHNPSTIDQIITTIIDPYEQSGKISPQHYEFQFLHGVHNGKIIGQQLLDAGKIVRDYMPVELNQGDAFPYMIRRLKANPELLFNALNNILSGRKLLPKR